QENHRINLLLGAMELSLEQSSVLALLQIFSAIAASSRPPPLPHPGPCPSGYAKDAPPCTHSSQVPQGPPWGAENTTSQGPSGTNLPWHGEVQSNVVPFSRMDQEAECVGRGVDSGGGKGSQPWMKGKFGGVEMLPQGVAVTVSVDVAAFSVSLEEGGVRITAAVMQAGHCKFQASDKEISGGVSLGDFRVLDFLAQPTTVNTLRPSAPAGVPETRAAAAAAAPGTGDWEGGEPPGLWVSEVMGRRDSSSGSMINLAMRVSSSSSGTEVRQVHGSVAGGRVDSGAKVVVGEQEAEVKMKMDSIRVVASIPFLESLSLHVLGGPLISALLDEGEGGVFPNPNPPTPSLPHRQLSPEPQESLCLDRDNGSGLSAVEVYGPRQGASGQCGSELAVPSSVSLKVQVEVSNPAVILPLDCGRNSSSSSVHIFSEFRHLVVMVTSHDNRPVHAGAQAGAQAGPGKRMEGQGEEGQVESLHIEVALAGATVRIEPEGFEVMEGVQLRAAAHVPLVETVIGTSGEEIPRVGGSEGEEKQEFVTSARAGGRDGIMGATPEPHHVFYKAVSHPPQAPDSAAAKLRNRMGMSGAGVVLPARPVLPEVKTGGTGHASCKKAGTVCTRARVAVRTSPVHLALADPHILLLASMAGECGQRLDVIADQWPLGKQQPRLPHTCLPPPIPGSPPSEGVSRERPSRYSLVHSAFHSQRPSKVRSLSPAGRPDPDGGGGAREAMRTSQVQRSMSDSMDMARPAGSDAEGATQSEETDKLEWAGQGQGMALKGGVLRLVREASSLLASSNPSSNTHRPGAGAERPSDAEGGERGKDKEASLFEGQSQLEAVVLLPGEEEELGMQQPAAPVTGDHPIEPLQPNQEETSGAQAELAAFVPVLGTLVIESVSFTLLSERPGSAKPSAGPGSPLGWRGTRADFKSSSQGNPVWVGKGREEHSEVRDDHNRSGKAGSAGTLSLSAPCSPTGFRGTRELRRQWSSGVRVGKGFRERYAPLLQLKVENVGIAVDVRHLFPLPGENDAGQDEQVGQGDGDNGNGGRQGAEDPTGYRTLGRHWLEVLVGAVSVLDTREKGRQGTAHEQHLKQLLRVGVVGEAGDDHQSPPAGGKGQSNASDVCREGCLLPPGWWRPTSGGDTMAEEENLGEVGAGDKGAEALIFRASLCPASRKLVICLQVAGACAAVLPAPLLEIMRFVSCLKAGLEESSRNNPDIASDVRDVHQGDEHVHRQTTARDGRQDQDQDRRVVGEQGDRGDGGPEGTQQGLERQQGVSVGGLTWRDLLLEALGMPSQPLPWVDQVDLTVCLHGVEVWLPENPEPPCKVEGRATTTSLLGGRGGTVLSSGMGRRPHLAMVVRFNFSAELSANLAALSMGTCLQTSLSGAGEIADPAPAPARSGLEGEVIGAGGQGRPYHSHLDEVFGSTASTAKAVGEGAVQLCQMCVGIHSLEVFVARTCESLLGRPLVVRHSPDPDPAPLATSAVRSSMRTDHSSIVTLHSDSNTSLLSLMDTGSSSGQNSPNLLSPLRRLDRTWAAVTGEGDEGHEPSKTTTGRGSGAGGVGTEAPGNPG
ncbi:unnamed protein product, partial [Discosporangium mesarthrocarpum]